MHISSKIKVQDPDGVVIDPSRDYFFESERGNIEGNSAIDMFGHNPNVSIGEIALIWDEGGPYTYLTADTTLYASSSNAGDNQLILITGLDDTYTEITRTVTLSGQSQVALSGLMFRVFAVINIDSTDTAGDVYISESDTLTGGRPDTRSKIKGKIIQGKNFSRMALFTSPAGKKGSPLSYTIGVGKGKDMNLLFAQRSEGGVFIEFAEIEAYQNYSFAIFKATEGLPTKTDFQIRCITGNNGASIFVEYDLLIYPE